MLLNALCLRKMPALHYPAFFSSWCLRSQTLNRRHPGLGGLANSSMKSSKPLFSLGLDIKSYFYHGCFSRLGNRFHSFVSGVFAMSSEPRFSGHRLRYMINTI